MGAVRMEEFINAFDYAYPQRDDATFAVYAEGAPSPFAADGSGPDAAEDRGQGPHRRPGPAPGRTPGLCGGCLGLHGPGGPAAGGPGRSESPGGQALGCGSRFPDHLCQRGEAAPGGGPRSAEGRDSPGHRRHSAGGSHESHGRAASLDTRWPARPLSPAGSIRSCSARMAWPMWVRRRPRPCSMRWPGTASRGSPSPAWASDTARTTTPSWRPWPTAGTGDTCSSIPPKQARDALVGQLAATLQTVAKDARIQVQFNPARVRRYRLIGYENRDIEDQRFRDDTVDAGEVGSGQCSTALYELELTAPSSGRWRQRSRDRIRAVSSTRRPGRSRRSPGPWPAPSIRRRSVEEDPRFFLAAGAARFAEWLRQSEHAQHTALADVQRLLDNVSAALPLDRDVQDLAALAHQAEDLPRASPAAPQP